MRSLLPLALVAAGCASEAPSPPYCTREALPEVLRPNLDAAIERARADPAAGVARLEALRAKEPGAAVADLHLGTYRAQAGLTDEAEAAYEAYVAACPDAPASKNVRKILADVKGRRAR